MKKKFLSLVLALCFVLTLMPAFTIGASAAWDGSASDTTWTGGGASAGDPYLITSEAELAGLSSLVNGGNPYSGKYFKLTANLDLAGYNWTPIGNNTVFQGAFDGDNHTISGLNVVLSSTTSDIYAGLFGYIFEGTVKNVNVSGSISGSASNAGSSMYVYIGGIVSNLWNGTIDNCSFSGNISGTSTGASVQPHVYAGGIVGMNRGTVINCGKTSGGVTASSDYNSFAGGIAGYNYNTIANCYNTGTVTAQGSTISGGGNIAGGIAGKSQSATEFIENCYNTGAVSCALTGTNNAANGIFGEYVVGGLAEYNYWLNTSATIGGTGINPATNLSFTEAQGKGTESATLIGAAPYADTTSLLDALNEWVTAPSGYKQWYQTSTVNGGYPMFAAHTVTFYNYNGAGNELLSTQYIADGETAEEIDDPTRTNYVFNGWVYSGGGDYSFSDEITADTTIYGTWLHGTEIVVTTGDTMQVAENATAYVYFYVKDKVTGATISSAPVSVIKPDGTTVLTTTTTGSANIPNISYGTNSTVLYYLSYAGDSVTYAPAAQKTLTFQKIATSVTNTAMTLTPSSSSVVLGQSVTLNAAVKTTDDPAVNVPQGTVYFYADGAWVGSQTVVNGSASVSYTPASIDASVSLTAVYVDTTTNAAYGQTDGSASLAVTANTFAAAPYITVTGGSNTQTGNVAGLAFNTAYTLTVSPEITVGGSNYNIQWLYSTNNLSYSEISGETGSTYAIPNTTSTKTYYKVRLTATTPYSGIVTSTYYVAVDGKLATTTSIAASPTANYEGSTVTLTATVKNGGTAIASGGGGVSFYDSSNTYLGYANLLTNGTAALTVTLPSYVSGSSTMQYYSTYSGDSTYATSSSDPTSVTVKSTTFEKPVVSVYSGATFATLVGTTEGGSVTGLTAGTTYLLYAGTPVAIDGGAVTAADYDLQWQMTDSNGNVTVVGIGETYTFSAALNVSYRLYVSPKNNMKTGASSNSVSISSLAAATGTFTATETVDASGAAFTGATDPIDGSHVGDDITLTMELSGTTTPTGYVDFYRGATKIAHVALSEWESGTSRAEYKISGGLAAGTYGFRAVYLGSGIYSPYDTGTKDPSENITYKVWPVTIDAFSIDCTPAVTGNLLTTGTNYIFSVDTDTIKTTGGELLGLGTDYVINWYRSTTGLAADYTLMYTSSDSDDNTWTQNPSQSTYKYKAVITAVSGSASAKLPVSGVTSTNTLTTDEATTTISVAADKDTVYEGNDIVLTATVLPTGTNTPTGTVDFYYTTDSAITSLASMTKISSANIQTKVVDGVTVYFATITTDVLPTNNSGLAQNVYIHANYSGDSANDPDQTDEYAAVNVRSSVIATGITISIPGTSLPADGSVTVITLDTTTVKTLDGDPLNLGSDYGVLWQKTVNNSATSPTWTLVGTDSASIEATPSSTDTAYRAVIVPKLSEKTKLSSVSSSPYAYISNIISAASANSVINLSLVPANDGAMFVTGTTARAYVNVYGGATAPTGKVTIGGITPTSNTNPAELVNGSAAFNFTVGAAGVYTVTATYEPTAGYGTVTTTETFYVRYAPTLSINDTTEIYGYSYDEDDFGIIVTSSGNDSAAAATVSLKYYKDAAHTQPVGVPSDAGTYYVVATLPETVAYAGASATGTLTIAPRPITVSKAVSQDKVYNGDTDVNILSYTTDEVYAYTDSVSLFKKSEGVLDGDSVIISGTAEAASAGVGTPEVTLSYLTISGPDAANYEISDPTGTVGTVKIVRNEIVAAISANGTITAYDAYGKAFTAYTATYYYHDGTGVKLTTDLKKVGTYTVVVKPTDTANYSGGISTTMTASSASAKTYVATATVTAPEVVTITNTQQVYNGSAKSVTLINARTNAAATGTYTVFYNGTTTAPTAVGTYAVEVLKSGVQVAVGSLTIVRAEASEKETISVENEIYGKLISPSKANDDDGYVYYTGGEIVGVSYDKPINAGSYIATYYANGTDSYLPYETSCAFTISKRPVSTVTAVNKGTQQYKVSPVLEYTITPWQYQDNGLDLMYEPSMYIVRTSNSDTDQVGSLPIKITAAYDKNYDFTTSATTYSNGTLSVAAVDPNIPLTIVGIPDGKLRYDDSFTLYTYGTVGKSYTESDATAASDSSVIKYQVKYDGDGDFADIIDSEGKITSDFTIEHAGGFTLRVIRGEAGNQVYSDVVLTAEKKIVKVNAASASYVYDGTSKTVNPDVFYSHDTLDTYTNVGQYAVTETIADDDVKGYATVRLTITPDTVNVTSGTGTSVYGGEIGSTDALDSSHNWSGTGSFPTAYDYTDATVISDADAYTTYAAAGAAGRNFTVTYTSGIYTVTRADALSVTPGVYDGFNAIDDSILNREYGEENDTMGFKVSTILSIDNLADLLIEPDDASGYIVRYDETKSTDANVDIDNDLLDTMSEYYIYVPDTAAISGVNYSTPASYEDTAYNIKQAPLTLILRDLSRKVGDAVESADFLINATGFKLGQDKSKIKLTTDPEISTAIAGPTTYTFSLVPHTNYYLPAVSTADLTVYAKDYAATITFTQKGLEVSTTEDLTMTYLPLYTKTGDTYALASSSLYVLKTDVAGVTASGGYRAVPDGKNILDDTYDDTDVDTDSDATQYYVLDADYTAGVTLSDAGTIAYGVLSSTGTLSATGTLTSSAAGKYAGTFTTALPYGTYTAYLIPAAAAVTPDYKAATFAATGGGGGGGVTEFTVTYDVGTNGTITSGSKTESVASGSKPVKVPTVTAKNDLVFKGWTLNGKTAVPGDTVITDNVTFVAVYAAHKCAAFTDIAGHWAFDNICFVTENDMFNGTTATTFSPEATMTRAMFVTVLYRMAGSPAVAGVDPFSDVAANEWYTNAVVFAANNGIVKGTTESTYSPNAPITREQMALILYNYAVYRGYDVSATNSLSAFTDAGSVSSWALTQTKWAVGEGLITGMTTTTLEPQGTATRAQVATILTRFVKTIGK